MNKIVNKFLLAGEKFMVDPIVKKYSVCGPFT